MELGNDITSYNELSIHMYLTTQLPAPLSDSVADSIIRLYTPQGTRLHCPYNLQQDFTSVTKYVYGMAYTAKLQLVGLEKDNKNHVNLNYNVLGEKFERTSLIKKLETPILALEQKNDGKYAEHSATISHRNGYNDVVLLVKIKAYMKTINIE